MNVTDPDGDNVTVTPGNLYQGALFDSGTFKFNWTPAYNQSGNYSVTIDATDGTDDKDSQSTLRYYYRVNGGSWQAMNPPSSYWIYLSSLNLSGGTHI